MKQNEEQRIKKIRAWNNEIFSEIYEAYVDDIYSYISRKVDKTNDVEDIVSKVFFKAFKNLSSSCAHNKPNIRARLYSIARTTVIDFYRHNSVAETTIENIDYIEDQSTSPLTISNNVILAETILQYIRQLWDDVCDLFIMRFRKQLSYAEITSINWKTINNNKKIFSRTCIQIREKFWNTLAI